MSGLGPEAHAEFLSDKGTEDKPVHLHNLLKFVALRKDRSAIMAAGGPWDKELDGGDPASGDSGLIKAAIRLADLIFKFSSLLFYYIQFSSLLLSCLGKQIIS